MLLASLTENAESNIKIETDMCIKTKCSKLQAIFVIFTFEKVWNNS